MNIDTASAEFIDLKECLNELEVRFNTPDFIEHDPISLPHRFSRKEDIEIAGFLAATIAWGNRKAIVKSGQRLINLLENDPYNFIMEASDAERAKVCDFVHRTFNGQDCLYFLESIRNIYTNHGGIGAYFEGEYGQSGDIRTALHGFWKLFFSLDHPTRVEKHLSSIAKGAACKRINMYIKWMVREDNKGVDFGLWKTIPSSALYLPLDVHTAAVGRSLGLLERKQNDWRAVEEITSSLRLFDISDPVRYDFALFGAGIHKAL